MAIIAPSGGDSMPCSFSRGKQQQMAGMKRKTRDDDWLYDDYKDPSLRLIRRDNNADPSSSRVSAVVDGAVSRVSTTELLSSSRASTVVDGGNFPRVSTTVGGPSSSARVCWQPAEQCSKQGQKRKDRDWSEGSIHHRRVCWQPAKQCSKQGQKRKDRDWSEGSIHHRAATDDDDDDDHHITIDEAFSKLGISSCQVSYDQALAAQMGW